MCCLLSETAVTCCLTSVCCNEDLLIKAGPRLQAGSDLIVLIEAGGFYTRIYGNCLEAVRISDLARKGHGGAKIPPPNCRLDPQSDLFENVLTSVATNVPQDVTIIGGGTNHKLFCTPIFTAVALSVITMVS